MINDIENALRTTQSVSTPTPFIFNGNMDTLREVLKEVGPAFVLISHETLEPPITVTYYTRYSSVDEMLLKSGEPGCGRIRLKDIGLSYKA